MEGCSSEVAPDWRHQRLEPLNEVGLDGLGGLELRLELRLEPLRWRGRPCRPRLLGPRAPPLDAHEAPTFPVTVWKICLSTATNGIGREVLGIGGA